MRKYTVVYENINDSDFEPGYYYAHIPALGITTHGFGLKGAKQAALDLVKLWTEDLSENDEESNIFVSTLEIN